MRVLYLSHNGVRTALVRSQVLPYLRGLNARGHDTRLITFERGVMPRLDPPGVPWHPVRSNVGSGLLAKAGDVARGVLSALRIVRGRHIDALHARSHVPAAICWAVGKLTGRPYIFDMRGFMGEEYIDGGRWTRDDIRFRLLDRAEKRLLRDAAEVVVLTDAAAERLRSDPAYRAWVDPARVTVIPCAVDLDRFRPAAARSSMPTLVYSGSLGMSYLIGEMLRVFAFAREELPELRMRILNREDRELILAAAAKLGVDQALLDVRAVDFDDMPAALAEAHVAIALLQQVPSKRASSPIKVAEYLACGLPTVVNSELGDLDGLVRRYAAGYVVGSYGENELRAAGRAVARLAADDAARRAARRLAEEVYALDPAVARYAAIYDRIASARRSVPG